MKNNYPLNVFLLIFLLILYFDSCTKYSDSDRAILETKEQNIYHILLNPPDEEILVTVEYGLEPYWEYSNQQVETLYERGFFFLFEKETSFTHSTNDSLEIIVKSIYSSSGAPPHLILLERNYFQYNSYDNSINYIKTEVLENDSLTLAPTRSDEFMDILYHQIMEKSEENNND